MIAQYSHRTNCQKGFTLVEMMVATAVVSIIITLTLGYLSSTLQGTLIKSARAQLLQDAQISLNIINRDIKHAANVDVNNRWGDDYAPDPTNPYSWESDADTLILASPAQDSNDNFLYLDPFAYITHKDNLIYFVEDGTLYRRTLAAEVSGNAATTTCPESASGCPADSVLAQDVTGFQVAYLDANNNPVPPAQARSVEVTLTLATQVYGRDVSVSYETLSVFRNE